MRLVYIGERESSKFIKGEIPDLNLISFKNNPNWREEIRDYNAHFSARLDVNKSVVKLANATALGAVFLTGREPGVEELLGEDYPFFLKAPRRLPSVLEDVENLKSSVGTTTWREARQRIQDIRADLTIDAVARQYQSLIAELTFS